MNFEVKNSMVSEKLGLSGEYTEQRKLTQKNWTGEGKQEEYVSPLFKIGRSLLEISVKLKYPLLYFALFMILYVC